MVGNPCFKGVEKLPPPHPFLLPPGEKVHADESFYKNNYNARV
jgi:hypothetical protein